MENVVTITIQLPDTGRYNRETAGLVITMLEEMLHEAHESFDDAGQPISGQWQRTVIAADN